MNTLLRRQSTQLSMFNHRKTYILSATAPPPHMSKLAQAVRRYFCVLQVKKQISLGFVLVYVTPYDRSKAKSIKPSTQDNSGAFGCEHAENGSIITSHRGTIVSPRPNDTKCRLSCAHTCETMQSIQYDPMVGFNSAEGSGKRETQILNQTGHSANHSSSSHLSVESRPRAPQAANHVANPAKEVTYSEPDIYTVVFQCREFEKLFDDSSHNTNLLLVIDEPFSKISTIIMCPPFVCTERKA